MAGIVLYVMLGITFSSSSPLERLKRSLNAEEESDCPPGIWTCLTGKREMRMLHEPAQDNIAEQADQLTSLAGCPPGVWTCDFARKREAAKRELMLKNILKQARRVQRSAQKCPPGIWVC